MIESFKSRVSFLLSSLIIGRIVPDTVLIPRGSHRVRQMVIGQVKFLTHFCVKQEMDESILATVFGPDGAACVIS